jgi:hypothetical protein
MDCTPQIFSGDQIKDEEVNKKKCGTEKKCINGRTIFK